MLSRINSTMMLEGLLLLMLGFHTRLIVEGSEWSYDRTDGTGPAYWSKHNELCGGKKQSPVKIIEKVTKFNENLEPFKFKNFNKVPENKNFTLENNGHALQVDIITSDPDFYQLSEGGLPGKYRPLQFHFHWAGFNSEKGSEHVLDDNKFVMELHIVHQNIKYPSVEEAVKHSDGLAVLGIFFKIDDDDNPIVNKLTKYCRSVRYIDSIVSIKPFPLGKLLPHDDELHYFRYNGSLTTPTCNEAVVWTLFKKPLKISLRQLDRFRMLLQGTKEDDDNKYISNNWRPVQNLNERVILRSYEEIDD